MVCCTLVCSDLCVCGLESDELELFTGPVGAIRAAERVLFELVWMQLMVMSLLSMGCRVGLQFNGAALSQSMGCRFAFEFGGAVL